MADVAPFGVVPVRVEPLRSTFVLRLFDRDVEPTVVATLEDVLFKDFLRDDERSARKVIAERDEDVDLGVEEILPRHLDHGVPLVAAAGRRRAGGDRPDLAGHTVDAQLRFCNPPEPPARTRRQERPDFKASGSCGRLDLLESGFIRNLKRLLRLLLAAKNDAVEPFCSGLVADDADEVGLVDPLDGFGRELHPTADVAEGEVRITEELVEVLEGDRARLQLAFSAGALEFASCLPSPVVP